MKASIILPTYNRDEFLARGLESCLNQTVEDIEIIVVNDGSTDGTGDLMEYFLEKDSRIRYFEKPNGGAADALNYGCERASSDVLMFAADDDIQLPTKVDVGLAGIEQPGVKFAYSGYYHCYKDGRVWQYCAPKPLNKDSLSEAASGGALVMWKRIWAETPYRDMTVNEDSGWLVDALKKRYKYAIVDEPSFKYCMHEGSLSRVRKGEVRAPSWIKQG